MKLDMKIKVDPANIAYRGPWRPASRLGIL
jgi:hypothetical protein